VLAEILKRTGLDNTGLAALGPVHRTQIGRWRGAKSRPDHDKLRLVCDGIRRAYPDLAPLAGELWQAAGYGEQPRIPALVSDNWRDEAVRKIWETPNMPERARLGIIDHYLAERDVGDASEGDDPPALPKRAWSPLRTSRSGRWRRRAASAEACAAPHASS
jgi:hypothetical protein